MTKLLLSSCKTIDQIENSVEKAVVLGKVCLKEWLSIHVFTKMHNFLSPSYFPSRIPNDFQYEWATYVLLNNEQANLANYRLNAFKACLLSANLVSEESQCLIKLTSTNMIASNYISEGIQLLFLIDQCLDACKYLISNGMWRQAIAYAKVYETFISVYFHAQNVEKIGFGAKK